MIWREGGGSGEPSYIPRDIQEASPDHCRGTKEELSQQMEEQLVGGWMEARAVGMEQEDEDGEEERPSARPQVPSGVPFMGHHIL